MANLTNKNAIKNIEFRVLNDAQCQHIFDAACDLLKNQGWTIGGDTNGRAKKYYAEAGCIVDGETIRFPRKVIESALESAPSEFTVYDQKGNPALDMSAINPKSYVTAAANPMSTFDIHTGERRKTYRKDAHDHALIQAAMANMDVPCGMVWIDDCPEDLIGTYEAREMLKVHTKPVALFGHDQADFHQMMKLVYAISGGKEKHIEKPFAFHIGSIGTVDWTIDIIESGTILFAESTPLVGAGAPVTLAGAIVWGLAQNLATLVLSQQIRKGYTYLASMFLDTMDFKTASYSQTAPEMLLASAAATEVFHYIGLPSNVHLGGTDSPIFDEQAAADIATQLMTGFMIGNNLSSFPGFLESGMACSPLALVYADEISGFLNNFINGVPVNSDTLAIELIEEVGFHGDYLGQMHTAQHIRDYWMPELFVRQSYKQWEAAGSKNFQQRATEKVLAILEEGVKDPKSPELEAEFDAIVDEATAKLGL